MIQFTCPHCLRPQIATEKNRSEGRSNFFVGETRHGPAVSLRGQVTRCLNPDCNEVTLVADLTGGSVSNYGHWNVANSVGAWRLIPESSAKPQPEYIPEPLRQDYVEACRIRDLSPKASATLARRCIQGMIRDFCGISKARLIDEIRALKALLDQDKAPRGVSADSIEAIDHLRSIGNIGAHMEKDIDLIIDVDPGEAQALIGLIEDLFQDWYVAREERRQRFAKIAAIGQDKAQQKAEGKAITRPSTLADEGM